MRTVVVLLVSSACVLLTPSAAVADCEWTTTTSVLDGLIQTQTVQICDDGSVTEEVADVEVSTDSEPCVIEALQALMDPVEFCDLPPEQVEDVVTPGLVAAALARLPLPPSQLQVQPANGRTLVNFETNFFTDAAPFDRTVTLLGQRVDLHIVPSGFGWRFGDGESLSTTDAGAPYPDLRITHTYQRKGGVTPAVDTTYTATYRVNGGPWAEVPGSVTVPGLPVGLEVLTATPVLVGY
jgi:hypothetical protein